MNRISLPLAAIAAALLFFPFADADAEELSEAQQAAVAMVDAAAGHVDSDGIVSLLDALNNKDERYLAGDLYLFVLNVGGTVVGNPAFPESVDKNPDEVKDADGNAFLSNMVAESRGNPDGVWFKYRWSTPSGTVGEKSSWLRFVDGHVLGAGVVTPN